MKKLHWRQRLSVLAAMLLFVAGLAACESEPPATVAPTLSAAPTQASTAASASATPTAPPSQEPTQSPEPGPVATASPTPDPAPLQTAVPATDATLTPEVACADLDHRYFRALHTNVSFGDYGRAGLLAFDVSPEAARLTFLHASEGAPNITLGEAPIQLDPDVQNNTLAESGLADSQALIVGENIYIRYDGSTPIPDAETGRWLFDSVPNNATGDLLVRVPQILQSIPFCNEFAESGEDSSLGRLVFSEVPSAIEGLRRYSREVPYTTENTNIEELWYDTESGMLTRFRESIPPIITDDQGNNMFSAVIERTYFNIGVVNPIAIPIFDRDEYSFELESSPAVRHDSRCRPDPRCGAVFRNALCHLRRQRRRVLRH